MSTSTSQPRHLGSLFAATFAICLACYLATSAGHLMSPDSEIQFRTTESLATGGWGAITFAPGEEIAGFATKAGPDGREFAQYGLGQPIAALPFYALGALLDTALPDEPNARLFPATTQYHDGSPGAWQRRMGVSFFNAFVTAATAGLLAVMFAAWGAQRTPSLVAGLLYGLGSYAWAHARTFFSEPLATLLVFAAFALLSLWHARESRGWWMPALAGALAGFGFLVRKDTPFFYPGLVLFAALPLWMPMVVSVNGTPRWIRDADRRAALLGTVAHLVAIVAFMLLHLGLSRMMFGSALAMGYEDQQEGIAFSAPLYSGLYGFLFSYGRGLIFFSPALVPAVFFWPRLWRRRPDLALGAVMVALPFFLLMCRWQNWAGGWSWGPRHAYQVHVFLALGWLPLLAGWRPEANPSTTPENHGAAWWLLIGSVLIGWTGAAMAASGGSNLGVIGASVLGGVAFGVALTMLLGHVDGDNQPASEPGEVVSARRCSPALRNVVVASLVVGAAVQVFGSSQNFIDFYQLYFRRVDVSPTSRVLYAPGEGGGAEVSLPMPDGTRTPPAPIWRMRVAAPINDSVYIPQNSAWYGYTAMWSEGYHDLLLVRLFTGRSGPWPAPAIDVAPLQ